MRSSALLLLLSFTIGVSSVAQASSTASTSPIKIVRCDAQFNYQQIGAPASSYVGYSDGYYPGTPYYWDDPYGLAYYQTPASSPSRLFIDFINVTHKTMKSAVFGLVVSDILISEVRDQGTFSPNAEIKRRYGIKPPATPRVKPTCVTLKVEYTDGTSWTLKPLPVAENAIYIKHH
jgi:hypothetical protein